MDKFSTKGNAIIIVITGVVILGFLGVIGFQAFKNSQHSFPSTGEFSEVELNSDDSAMGGKYMVYSASTLAENADKKRVLYFYANWCPICRPVDAEFKARSDEIPENTVVIRINYNDSDTDSAEEALAEKYGIIYQHTFVLLDENGNELAKWNSGGIDELIKQVN